MAPLLSIGILFHNDLENLQQCLPKLQPLQKALGCELIMGNLGAQDGSRELAHKFADKVIDISWSGNRAKVRNILMNSCSGKWLLFLDSDEFIEGNLEELSNIISEKNNYTLGMMTIRSYRFGSDKQQWSTKREARLIRLKAGITYTGITWEVPISDGKCFNFQNLNIGRAGKTDSMRFQTQDNWDALQQNTEMNSLSGAMLLKLIWKSDFSFKFKQKAIQLAEQKKFQDEAYTAAFLISITNEDENAQEEMLKKCMQMCPKGIHVGIDVCCISTENSYMRRKYDSILNYCEHYFMALNKLAQGEFSCKETIFPYFYADKASQRTMYLLMAYGLAREMRHKEAAKILSQFDVLQLSAFETIIWLDTISWMQINYDYKDQIARVGEYYWGKEQNTNHNWEKGRKIKKELASRFFNIYDDDCENWLIFSILSQLGKCDITYISKIYLAKSRQEYLENIKYIENFDDLPVHVIYRLWCTNVFPDPLYNLPLENITEITEQIKGWLSYEVVIRNPLKEKRGKELHWQYNITYAYVSALNFNSLLPQYVDEICQFFTNLTEVYFSWCYCGELLTKDLLFTMPANHQFGWHILQAKKYRESENNSCFVNELRLALKVVPEMKNFVSYLLCDFQRAEKRKNIPSAVLEIADEIHLMLQVYSDDHPVIKQLKKSSEYQNLAYLIE